MKNIIRKTISILLIIITLALIVVVGKNTFSKLQTNKTYDEVKNISSKQTDSNNSFNELKSLNSDYKFWLDINNTNIDYPVMQGNDNDFYLNHDFYKEELRSGSLFIDYKNSFDTDFNTVIYGHNLKDGNMFSNLINFKDENFFKQNNNIRITNDNYVYTFKPVSIYVVEENSDINYLYDINNQDHKLDKVKYLDDLRAKSLFKTNLDFSSSDKIITLITCSYEFNNARTIIHASLVDKQKLST